MGSTGVTRPEDRERLRPWLEFWLASVGGAFLGAYFADLGDAHFLPRTEAERAMVIDCLLLERTIVDLVEDLAAAPERVPGRLRTLRGLIG
jgi:maltose alpha-D-glucosyltransferase/alpha-amylase